MGIEPESKLAWLILVLHEFGKKKHHYNWFIEDNRLAPSVYNLYRHDDEMQSIMKNNEEELLGLTSDYFSIYIKISGSGLLLKFGDNDFILTSKLLEFGKSISKLPPCESNDFLKNKDDEEPKGVLEKQIALICKTAENLNYVDLKCIPRGGRAAIRAECLRNHLLTKDQFKRAWTELNKRKITHVLDK